MEGGIDNANAQLANRVNNGQVIVEHNRRTELVEERLDKTSLKVSIRRIEVALSPVQHDIVIQPVEAQIVQVHFVHGARGANRNRNIWVRVGLTHGSGKREQGIAENHLAVLHSEESVDIHRPVRQARRAMIGIDNGAVEVEDKELFHGGSLSQRASGSSTKCASKIKGLGAGRGRVLTL